MSTVIEVENLFKQYRLGQVSTGSIAHDLNRWWHTVRGKEDPYEKITGINNREENGNNDYVWALQDINFSVKQGEVLGIIGRNGAGKSTLLKILSKVTSPTKGNIKVKGRIASLLEVGTGFHPELTGRENIFLNGAILGMTKSEIRSKFDEIVAFSGVEKYIDTPVKRYSSGMYVRLAFAVAAHLEPEILIVDEVLAVGDAEFQKKCLGKMKDVSGEGRTVLFVSHNMAAVQNLCNNSVLMENGKVEFIGYTNDAINLYYERNKPVSLKWINNKSIKSSEIISSVSFENLNSETLEIIPIGLSWQIKIKFQTFSIYQHFLIGIGISDIEERAIHTTWGVPSEISPGSYEVVFINKSLMFSSGIYYLSIGVSNYETNIEFLDKILKFEIKNVKDRDMLHAERILRTEGVGVILNPMDYKLNNLQE
jgi:lipopolysaccharide transport system ATP-binding protein